MTGDALLTVDDLRVGVTGGAELVRGVSLTVPARGALAVVGESGSGKSLTFLSVLGLLPPGLGVAAGGVTFDGRELVGLPERAWQRVRGREIGMIFQNPSSSLNPCFTVGYQIAEMFRRHEGAGRKEAHERAVELMTEVGIPDARRRVDTHPHQFSGGMRQRVMIAMALALHPRLLVADEPTTALDVTVQAQILRLLRQRQEQERLALVLVSHDLGVVARAAESVAVMYAGQVVEHGPVLVVYAAPAHPYTRGLLAAVPDRRGARRLTAVEGQPPDPNALPPGCAFEPRCPFAQQVCRETPPPLRTLPDGRSSACHFAEDVRDAPAAREVSDA